MFKTPALLLALALTTSGCATFLQGPPPENTRIYAFHSSAAGGYTSAYYLTTNNGALLFDAPMTSLDALALSQEIRINTSEPLDAIYLLSALPEHYAGAGELVGRTGARLLASKDTAALISAKGQASVDTLESTMGEPLPMVILEPDATFKVPATRRYNKVRILLIDGGAGPSGGMTAAYMPQLHALLPGALVFNNVHPRLTGQRSDVWIASLQELSKLDIDKVMPGRGRTGGPELITSSILYLRTLQSLVTEAAPEGVTLTEDLQARLVQGMIAAYPRYALPELLPGSIKDEWTRQGGLLSDTSLETSEPSALETVEVTPSAGDSTPAPQDQALPEAIQAPTPTPTPMPKPPEDTRW